LVGDGGGGVVLVFLFHGSRNSCQFVKKEVNLVDLENYQN